MMRSTVDANFSEEGPVRTTTVGGIAIPEWGKIAQQLYIYIVGIL